MSTKQAKTGIPSYTRHKASGQARVTLNGVDFYLGRWNSPESRANYDRVTTGRIGVVAGGLRARRVAGP